MQQFIYCPRKISNLLVSINLSYLGPYTAHDTFDKHGLATRKYFLSAAKNIFMNMCGARAPFLTRVFVNFAAHMCRPNYVIRPLKFQALQFMQPAPEFHHEINHESNELSENSSWDR